MTGLKSHEIPAAHEIVKGDPRIDGPYLDDYNEAYLAARRDLSLAGQESQLERYESDDLDYKSTEGTELNGEAGEKGTEERVLSQTGTTRTTVKTESLIEAPSEDNDSQEVEGETSEDVEPENSEVPENNPSFDENIEGSGSENV